MTTAVIYSWTCITRHYLLVHGVKCNSTNSTLLNTEAVMNYFWWLWIAPVCQLGVADTFWLFIFTLNRAKNWFNSIFNSKLNQKYSFKKLFIQIGKINSKNYSIQNWIKNIHSNWKNNLSLRKQWKTCKMGRFFLKTHFLFIFLMNFALFWFIQKFIQWYGKNIHSKKIFIQ